MNQADFDRVMAESETESTTPDRQDTPPAGTESSDHPPESGSDIAPEPSTYDVEAVVARIQQNPDAAQAEITAYKRYLDGVHGQQLQDRLSGVASRLARLEHTASPPVPPVAVPIE